LVVRGTLGLRHATVRIVTGQAGQCAAALDRVAALVEAVGVVIDLEATGGGPALLVDVHLHQVVRQRLSGLEREVAAAEATQPRQGHGRLEVAVEDCSKRSRAGRSCLLGGESV
jgi:hypothetical protein